ncbi:MAG: AlpA family phage regulatory protein [Halobacteriovoraceae bacterium]|nr:AlpA family phage regulatory protein [Halobacteriovoraceae bacterium]
MEQILSIKEVEKLTHLSRSTIRRLEIENEFPKRTKLGKARVGWFETEIIAWIEELKLLRKGDNNA